MTVSSGDIVRATAVMDFEGEAVENVYHFLVGVAGSGDDLDIMDDIALHLDDAYDELAPGLSTSLIFVEIRGFNETQDAPMPTVLWPSQVAGAEGSDPLPLGAAMLAVFRTAASRVIGRKFLGVWTESGNANGEFNAATLLLGAAYVAELLANVATPASGGAINYVIKKAGSLLFEIITEATVGSEYAYQRRRRRGRGD